MLNKQYLLPLSYMKRTNGKRSISVNEKTLILILIVLTIVTLFVILNNLPSQVNLREESALIKEIFVPKLSQNGNSQVIIHEKSHRHELVNKKVERVSPETQVVVIQPIEAPGSNLPSMAERREKIKSVRKCLIFYYFIWNSIL